MIKREQRLLADSAERSNFTESKVKSPINNVKTKTVSHCPWLRSFCLACGLDRKRTRRSKLILTKSALNIIFSETDFRKNKHLFFNHFLCSRH